LKSWKWKKDGHELTDFWKVGVA